jgi:hypothetical protein
MPNFLKSTAKDYNTGNMIDPAETPRRPGLSNKLESRYMRSPFRVRGAEEDPQIVDTSMGVDDPNFRGQNPLYQGPPSAMRYRWNNFVNRMKQYGPAARWQARDSQRRLNEMDPNVFSERFASVTRPYVNQDAYHVGEIDDDHADINTDYDAIHGDRARYKDHTFGGRMKRFGEGIKNGIMNFKNRIKRGIDDYRQNQYINDLSGRAAMYDRGGDDYSEDEDAPTLTPTSIDDYENILP